MNRASRQVIHALVIDALHELANQSYQETVWVRGSVTEVASLDETVAALFSDSGLDEALEKNPVTYSVETDRELRELRIKLKRAIERQSQLSIQAIIQSAEWEDVRTEATRLLGVLSNRE